MKRSILILLLSVCPLAAFAQSSQWVFTDSRKASLQKQWLEGDGTVMATDFGEAVFEIVPGSPASHPVNVIKGKKPGVQGLHCGDSWVFTLPASHVKAGTFIEFDLSIVPSALSPRYFVVEYNDAGVWVPADGLREENGIAYTFKLFGDAPVEQHTSVIKTFKAKSDLARKDFIVVRARVAADIDCQGNPLSDDPASAVYLEPSTKTAADLTILGDVAPKDTTSVLCIGNSFTYVHSADWMLKRIAWTQGHYLDMETSVKGGQTFGQHLGLMITAEAISKGGYDYVFLQNQSQTNAWYAQDKKGKAQILADAVELSSRVRAASPDAVQVVEATWSYVGKSGENGGFKSLKEFDKLLLKGSKAIAKSTGGVVSPIGAAFAVSRAERPDIDLYDPDHKHQSAYGAYLKACVNYLLMFGGNFEGYVDDCHLSSEKTAYLRSVAERIVK